jgi:glycyl-tRNA synthetase beta chain
MPHFLFEVGTEELPATFVDSAIKQWRSRPNNRFKNRHTKSSF